MSIAAFGAPAVPSVNSSTATSECVARHARGRLGVTGAVERRAEHDGGLDRRELAVELEVGGLRVQRYRVPRRPAAPRDTT